MLRLPNRSVSLGTALIVAGAFVSASCNERFEFDVGPAVAGSAGALTVSGAAGAGGRGGAPAAGGGSAGSQGLAGGASRCGTRAACPDNLRCANDECVECVEDLDCADSATPHCHPARHRCVACLISEHCEMSFACDERANKCLPTCQQPEDCPDDAHGCNEQLGVCYDCDEDRECEQSALGPLCALDGSGCVVCRENGDCDSRCDVLTGRCVDCVDGDDCPSGFCDPVQGLCLDR